MIKTTTTMSKKEEEVYQENNSEDDEIKSDEDKGMDDTTDQFDDDVDARFVRNKSSYDFILPTVLKELVLPVQS
ncbi:hypothetical protein Tco_0306744 [Tanacetum coccineum]